ncbi:MAG: DUF2490 domain-containing protein [Legionella sp.]|uniref:DUF2490 domain-containing protein n=1 Tax=Legionella sp. TaxID=459 RepID=UPI0039E4835E
MKAFWCFLLFWMMLAAQTKAATESDFQTWPNLTAIGKFHKADKTASRFRYWLENQERIGEDSRHFSQILVRPGLGYALTNHLSLWVGYGWIYTGRPFTTHPFEENRIWQQLLWVKKLAHSTFTSRTRMEQRFLENNLKTIYRVRQFVKLAVPLKVHPRWSIVGSDELFLHKNNYAGRNSQGFDQNRFFIGLGYQFNSGFTLETGYMNQYIRRFSVPNFCSNILAINFLLSL